jgi:hypothetical protein
MGLSGPHTGLGAQIAAQGWRTVLLVVDPDAWVAVSCAEFRAAARRVRRSGGTVLAGRPSILDDLLHPEGLLSLWRSVVAEIDVSLELYRYSKAPHAMLRDRSDHVTYSWHEHRKGSPIAFARRVGRGVAVVGTADGLGRLATQAAAASVPVVDGDASDYRPADPTGPSVVALRYKYVTDGRSNAGLIADAAGFVLV